MNQEKMNYYKAQMTALNSEEIDLKENGEDKTDFYQRKKQLTKEFIEALADAPWTIGDLLHWYQGTNCDVNKFSYHIESTDTTINDTIYIPIKDNAQFIVPLSTVDVSAETFSAFINKVDIFTDKDGDVDAKQAAERIGKTYAEDLGDKSAYKYDELTKTVTYLAPGNGPIPEAILKTAEHAVIENGVTEIPDKLFEDSTIQTVSIPKSVTTIGVAAFNKSALKEIVIPDNVTSIGETAFASCVALKSAEIGNGVSTIPSGAFFNCSKLSKVRMGNNLTSLADGAFYNCSRLSFAFIPNKVTSIGKMAFADCYNLQKARLPYGLKTIEEKVFSNCKKLDNIILPKRTLIADNAFENSPCEENAKAQIENNRKTADTKVEVINKSPEEATTELNTLNEKIHALKEEVLEGHGKSLELMDMIIDLKRQREPLEKIINPEPEKDTTNKENKADKDI